MAELRRHFTGVAATFEPDDSFTPAARTDHPLRRYLGRVLAHAGLLPRILLVSLFIQIAALALPVLTGAMVDRVLPRGDGELLWMLGLGMAVLVVFQFTSAFLRAHLLLHLATRMDIQMTVGFTEHLASLPYEFFQVRSAGDLLMRMSSNATMREIITSASLSAVIDGTLVTLYLVLLCIASPIMAAVAVVLALVHLTLFLASRRRQRELMAESLETRARCSNYEVEMLTSMETLKSMGAEQQAVDRWANLFIDTQNVALARGRLNALFGALGGTLGMAGPLVLMLAGGALVLRGNLSLGTMLAVNALAAGFLTPLGSLFTTAVQLQLLGSYVERINDVLQTAPERTPGPCTTVGRLRGRIEVEAASFRFGPDTPLVVDQVSAVVEPEQHVAIVGRTGAGKSTLARLLVGLYEPTSGRILFDGLDLRQLERRVVRRQMGIVTQDPQLFGGTIRDNIALGDPELPLAAVVRAARLAGLHDEIMAMPMGYDTLLADRGLSLSGGQRQRIALARALVRQPAVLLLDEATSAVDTLTERQIQDAVAALRCTRVTIAHRLSTIKRADLILVLDGGAVVARGTYAALARQPGLFAELVSAQETAADEAAVAG
jgi:ABC-type bacteriocin/lantibiotic exporter with double-glycine peptidase domain